MKTMKGNKRVRNRRNTIKQLRHPKRHAQARQIFAGGDRPASSSSVDLPVNFRLSENFSETAESISRLRRLRDGRPPYKINFNNVAKVDGAAALMLAAEIDAWNRGNPHIKLWSQDRHWNSEVTELLDEMGLFKLLGVARQSDRRPVHDGRDLIFIPFMRGSHADDLGNIYIPFLEKIEKHMAAPIQQRFHLLTGMGEAVINAWEHGYERKEGAEWWVSASCNKATGELTVICYDRGLTIPKTLPRSKMWESIRDMVGANIDCDMIEAALTTRRTQTRRLRRGKGLFNLMKFVDESGRGMLIIYSRRGMVCYDKSTVDENGKFSKKQMEKPIEGTLIEWRVVPR